MLSDAFEWSMRWVEYRAAQLICIAGILGSLGGLIAAGLIFWPLAILLFIPLYGGFLISLNALIHFQRRFRERVVWPISPTADRRS